MVTTNLADPIALDLQHVLQVYKRAPVVFESGKGCALFTREGERYLDLISGVGVASLGHAHPALARAIADQASTLLHTSNLFHHPLQAELATRLSALSGLPRAFFCNSGAEAVETCLKFARRFWHTQGTPRAGFVAFMHSFHGRTMGAVSVTWDPHYRDPFQPLVPGVTFVDPRDTAAVSAAITTETAAVIVEPIQGEGGVRPISQATADAIARGLPAHRRAAHRRRSAVRPRPHRPSVLRERAGSVAGSDGARQGARRRRADWRRDVLGSRRRRGQAWRSRQHLRRQPARVPRRADVSRRARPAGCSTTWRRVGAHLERGLRAMASRQGAIRDVRGAGLMWGLDIDRPAAAIVDAARERRLLINRTSDTVIRLLPPYVITEREIDEALPLLEAAIASTVEGPRQ